MPSGSPRGKACGRRSKGAIPASTGCADWAPGYRREAWRRGLEELGAYTPGLAADLAGGYVERQRSGHPMVDGAAQVVAALGSSMTVGLLTNGPSDIQRAKHDRTGLEQHFDAVVISGEVAVGKPDPRAFSTVLDALGVEPADAVMVGDSWERDVIGALDAGMAAVWISGGAEPPDAGLGVPTIRTVADLDEIVIG
jgi:putative hydrolase of the HAD superfamily